MSLFVTNRSLLDRFRLGDPGALRTVYWEYVRKIERILSGGFEVRGGGARVGGLRRQPDELADLVQEVFLRAFSKKGRQGYDGLRAYAPYLYAIARNVLVDSARARGREIPAPSAELEAAIDATQIEADTAPWEAPDTIRVVETYLAALPEQLRAVHKLRYQECLSQEQTAQRLGVSRQTLRTLEHRLQHGLAAALDAEGIGDERQPRLGHDQRKLGRNELPVE